MQTIMYSHAFLLTAYQQDSQIICPTSLFLFGFKFYIIYQQKILTLQNVHINFVSSAVIGVEDFMNTARDVVVHVVSPYRERVCCLFVNY